MLRTTPFRTAPADRLAPHVDEFVEYLDTRFRAFGREQCREIVHEAFANANVWRSCPETASDDELRAWFRRVLHNDAIDVTRHVARRRQAATEIPIENVSFTSPDPLSRRNGAINLDASRVAAAGEDRGLSDVAERDERARELAMIEAGLAAADPETARLLRARLDEQTPAQINLREGWSRRMYEYRITAAHRRLASLIAQMESDSHCSGVRALLRQRSDELLAPATKQAIDEHVFDCLACRAFRLSVRDRARRRIAALFPWPVPGFVLRFLGREVPVAETAAGAGAGGGLLAAGLFSGGQLAAIACSGVVAAAGCIGLVTFTRSPEPTRSATISSRPSAPTAAAAPPAASVGTRPATGATIAGQQQRTHAAQQRAERRAKERAAARERARARAARRASRSGGEGEFGPQPGAPAPRPTPPAAAAAAPTPAPTPTPTPAPAPEPPSSSNFQNEFTP